MVSPQKENGYTPIANEIMEQLCKINLSSYQSRLLFAVWRKTYGYNKKEDWLSNSQLVELTGLKKQHVSRAKKELIERKLVTSTGDKIQFNKCYSQWCELPKSVTKETVTNTGNVVTNTGAIVTSTGDHSNQYRGTQKKQITKENIQKKIPKGIEQSSYGNEDINKMLEFLKQALGLTDFKETKQSQRNFGKHLVGLMEKIGKEEFRDRLQELAKDQFHLKNMGSLQYLYKNIKGFVKAKPVSGNIAIIS